MSDIEYQNIDKVSLIKDNINSVKESMTRNINLIIERGDKIENLIDKTADLEENSNTFRKKSTELKRKTMFKHHKVKIIIILFILEDYINYYKNSNKELEKKLINISTFIKYSILILLIIGHTMYINKQRYVFGNNFSIYNLYLSNKS